MEESPAREFGDSADAALREHFVSHRRIGDIGIAGAERGRYAVLLTHKVDMQGDVIGYDGAEVAGVGAVAACHKHVAHIPVDEIYSGTHRSEKAGTRHHDVDVAGMDIASAKEGPDFVAPHGIFVHDMLETGKGIRIMLYVFLKDGLPVHEITHPRRGGPGVYRQHPPFRAVILLY